MTKMTDAERKALFDEGVARHAHYKTSRARETELARIQVKARVQADLDDRNAFYAALVDDHGFTIADIGRIMGTSNRGTAKAAVENGRAVRPAQPVQAESVEQVEGAQKYTYDAGSGELTVRLSREDIAPYLPALTHLDAPSEDGEVGAFLFRDGRLVPTPESEGGLVAAVMTFPAVQRDAVAFIEGE